MQSLVREQSRRGFEIGDLVNSLVDEHGLTVQQIAAAIGGSRQRLSELRRTASAFPPSQRMPEIDVHLHTIAARAARRLKLDPARVLDDVLSHGFASARQATRYLARRIQQRDLRRQRSTTSKRMASSQDVFDRCHHADYRLVLQALPAAVIKLIIADPPYGQYAGYADGAHDTTTAGRRSCDGLSDADARAVTTDLLRLALPKLAAGGCLVLFRPGGAPDPAWLLDAAAEYGWSCRHAVIWDKGRPQLGRSAEAYGIGTERLLIFARQGETLVNHDGSPRHDVLRVPPVRRSAADVDRHHFEKPIELMRRLINKHTVAGELVAGPFGGTGPASVAAIELQRRWFYCETHRENYAIAARRIDKTMSKHGSSLVSSVSS